MKNSHMFQDSGTVVGDDYFTIAGLNLGTSLTWASGGDLGIVELCWSYHFIHTTRTERCTNGITNSYKSVSRSCCEVLWVVCVTWQGTSKSWRLWHLPLAARMLLRRTSVGFSLSWKLVFAGVGLATSAIWKRDERDRGLTSWQRCL